MSTAEPSFESLREPPRESPLGVICGPTGAGKSALAMQLAERFPITIISADSRQIYRGFDIGTAKPTAAEQALVPHAGIDVADAEERWSAWQWAMMARDAMRETARAGRMPVVVGGTGFYVRALVQPLAALPPLDEARRARLSAWLDAQTPDLWRRWCERLDPERAALGPVQWRRAIETALLTGTRLSRWHARAEPAEPLRVRYLLVDPGASLGARIDRRVHAMLEAGWIDEVVRLQQVVPEGAPAWQGTGYTAVRAHVRGTLPREAMVTEVIVRTRQYAKRQRTWYRHQLGDGPVNPVDPSSRDIMDEVLAWWQALREETV